MVSSNTNKFVYGKKPECSSLRMKMYGSWGLGIAVPIGFFLRKKLRPVVGVLHMASEHISIDIFQQVLITLYSQTAQTR